MLLKRLIRCALVWLLFLSPVATNLAAAREEVRAGFLRPTMLAGERESLGKSRQDVARHAKGKERKSRALEMARLPKAKLKVRKVSRSNSRPAWIKLDARKSKARRSRGHERGIDSYQFIVREAETGRQLPGPGSSSEPVAHVRLPAGRYRIGLTVRDAEGREDTKHRKLFLRGAPSNTSGLDRVQWSLDRRFRPGQSASVFQRAPGIAPLGVVKTLLSANTRSTLLGSGGGCGGALNNGGNGIGIVTGVMGFGVTFAAPEFKVAATGAQRAAGLANSAGAGMKIAGGNKSGSCVQSQINAINDQLRFQEEQIQELYSIINRDEDAFFFALKQIDGQVGALVNEFYSSKIGNVHSLLDEFMVGGALWESAARGPWMQLDAALGPVSLDLLSIAACDLTLSSCCAGAASADSDTCENAARDGGPMANLEDIVPSTLDTDIVDITAATLNNAPCEYDCWRNVAPANVSDSALLQVYTRYAEHLFDAVVLCTAEDPDVRSHCPNRLQQPNESEWVPPEDCLGDTTDACTESSSSATSNDVVPLFDQYNDAIGSVYLQSLVALQQAYSMEQLVNLYNYNRYVANQCSRGLVDPGEATQDCLALEGQSVGLRMVPSYSRVEGTLYEPGMLRACNGGTPSTPQEHADALVCAQQQLGLLYAQRLNVLYRHALSYVISDGPVGSQVYPTTEIAFPESATDAVEALREWNMDVEGGGLGAFLDYGAQVGSALPPFMDGARTPLELLERVAGTQTNAADGSNWTDDGVLYQAYQIGDVAACVNTLLAFNAEGNPDTKIEDVYQDYEDCPSIFALEDTTGLVWGFYDGVTMQPYTSRGVSGAPTDCPDACQTCADGRSTDPETFEPGGQGLLDLDGALVCGGYCSGDNVCGDYRFTYGDYTDCTSCGLDAPDPAPDWDAVDGANGSWSLSCDLDSAVFSGTDSNPTLQADCNDSTGSFVTTAGPATCPGARWGNNNGTLFCESTSVTARFALNPPLGGNVRQCRAFGAEEALRVAGEGDLEDFSCTGDVVYGKAFANSLEPTSVMPGDGTYAKLEETLSDSQHLRASYSSTINCTNDFFGEDPAPGFYKQCFCIGGNQLTWIRPSSTLSSSEHASSDNQSLIYDPLKAGLPYLSCGNYRTAPNGPRAAWEYGGSGGDQLMIDDDEPPTIFKERRTTADAGLESDIGIRSDDTSVASGVNYEVAFVNLYEDCNNFDNIQVDVRPRTSGVVAQRSGDQDSIDISSSSDEWASKSNARFTNGVTAKFPKIENRSNATSAFLSLLFEAPNLNALGIASGPSIPMDLVMQCSDDGDNECENQSSCMHMVTFRDANWTIATIEKRAEVMAKRGFVCQSVDSYRPDGDRFGISKMHCELSDGRLYQFELRAWIDGSVTPNDNRARLMITELTSSAP